MPNLQSISISNFQAHKELKIELGDGITTIVGPSDVGKSAVLRALKWLALNSFRGFEFLRWGAKRVQVCVSSEDSVICRARSDKENTYSLSLAEDDVCQFEAVSGSVPPEIANELRVTEDNFQGQFDQPFWLSETAGTVSRHLNRIVNLEIVDRYLTGAASNVRRRAIERDAFKESRDASLAALRSWDFVLQSQGEWDKIQELYGEYSEEDRKIARLDPLCDSISREQSLLESLSVPDELPFDDVLADIQRSQSPLDRLGALVLEIQTACGLLGRTTDELDAATVEYESKYGQECPLCGK